MKHFSENSAKMVRSERVTSLKPFGAHKRAPSLLVAAGLSSLIACSSNKNYEERAALARAEDPYCLGLCQPDELPAIADCAGAEHGLEFVRLWDFEAIGGAPTGEGMYIYDDKSARFSFPDGYEPPSTPDVLPNAEQTRTPAARCGTGNEHAMHVWGGPFLSWGGGIGRKVCVGDALRALCGGPEAEFPGLTMDVSAWEGVSFWARRGPNGQTGIRIAVGDKHTDDDISYTSYHTDVNAPRYCERTRECGCRSESMPCNYYEDPDPMQDGNISGYYCWDPAVDSPPALKERDCDPNLTCEPEGAPSTARAARVRTQYEQCGETKCDADYEAYPDQPDRQFHTPTSDPAYPEGRIPKACTPFAFRGGISGAYCFDPGVDPEPAEANLTCGDHWLAGVTLTTEWQFFKVPFTELLQQGWAKEFPKLDLTSVALIRMTWDKGWADYWIDDVSFYRKARN